MGEAKINEYIKAAREFFEIPTIVRLSNKDKKAYGEFRLHKEDIVIYYPKLRTLRDFLFVLGHEFAHAWQYKSVINYQDYNILYLNYQKKYGYLNNPLEVEADKLGFAFEDSLDYKNEILNPDEESIFIHRKILRNAS